MAKKITAFCAGRKNGNTETYMKIALMEAKKMGVDVELIRLNECNVLPCKACANMPLYMEGTKGLYFKR